MAFVILLIYFVGVILCRPISNSKTSEFLDYFHNITEIDMRVTTVYVADIHKELDGLRTNYPEDKGYQLGIEAARGRLVPEIANLRKTVKDQEKEIKAKDLQLFKQGLPVQLANEFDRFIEIHENDITLTKEELTTINNINDESKKARVRLTKVCEHVINDLSTDPLIKKLNEEIDLVENKNLIKLTKAKRITSVCNALVALKFDRNAKVHEVFMNGPRIKKIKLFRNNDCWNEGLVAFLNGHQTGVDFTEIEYET